MLHEIQLIVQAYQSPHTIRDATATTTTMSDPIPAGRHPELTSKMLERREESLLKEHALNCDCWDSSVDDRTSIHWQITSITSVKEVDKKRGG